MAANKRSKVRLTTPSLSARFAAVVLGVASLSLAAPAAADIPLPTGWVVPVSGDAVTTAESIQAHAGENATTLQENATSLATNANATLNPLDPTGPHAVYDPTTEVSNIAAVVLDLPGGLAGEALAWESRSYASINAEAEQTRVAAFAAAGTWTGLAGSTFVATKAAVDGIALQAADSALDAWNGGYGLADSTVDSAINLLGNAVLPALCQIVSVFEVGAADGACGTASHTIGDTVANPLTNPLDPPPSP